MADDKKVVLERQYNVPLRREFIKVPQYKRAKKAITAIKQFMEKHMKSETIKLDLGVNLAVWKHGIKNPPHHIKVVAKKYDDNSVHVTYADSNIKVQNKLRNLAKKNQPKPEKKAVKKAVSMKSKALQNTENETVSSKKENKDKKDTNKKETKEQANIDLKKNSKSNKNPKVEEKSKLEPKEETRSESKETKPEEPKEELKAKE